MLMMIGMMTKMMSMMLMIMMMTTMMNVTVTSVLMSCTCTSWPNDHEMFGLLQMVAWEHTWTGTIITEKR
jgi:hypothetical protein